MTLKKEDEFMADFSDKLLVNRIKEDIKLRSIEMAANNNILADTMDEEIEMNDIFPTQTMESFIDGDNVLE